MLGIIACKALEDELAHVLSEDSELRHLILIDNTDCFDLSRKLRSKNCSHLLADWEDIPDVLKDFEASPGIFKPLLGRSRLLCGLLGKADNISDEISVVVNVLKIALHIDNKTLRDEVCKSVELMSQFSDSILLFYGRCGNALQDIEVSQDRDCSLLSLIDDSGEIADDCIAVALGGNKQYAEVLSSHQGVGYFCTPMWASNLGYADREAKRYAIEHHLKPKTFGDALVELGYSKIAILDTGLNFTSNFEVESIVNEFASIYRLKIVRLRGNAEIAERCYRHAKENMSRTACKRWPGTPGGCKTSEAAHPTKGSMA